jgi:hypothetical protein
MNAGSGGMSAGSGGMAGSGGVVAGAGGANAGSGGSAGAAGAGGSSAGAGGAGAGGAGAGGAGAGGAGAGGAGAGGAGAGGAGAGGAGGSSAGTGGGPAECTEVSDVEPWIFGNAGFPGYLALYQADATPNIGDVAAEYFDFQIYNLSEGEGERTGTFQLGQGIEANFATCARCFFVVIDDDVQLFASSGTLVISEDSTPMSGDVHMTLTNATFVEVTIDDETFVSTPVPNGRCVHVTSLDFTRGL